MMSHSLTMMTGASILRSYNDQEVEAFEAGMRYKSAEAMVDKVREKCRNEAAMVTCKFETVAKVGTPTYDLFHGTALLTSSL